MSFMADEPKPTDDREGSYVLPRYLRFARTLALVSGATVGIAAGVAVISISGCESTCSGFCGHQVTMGVRPIPGSDAADVGNDLGGGADAGAASADAVVDAATSDGTSETGGGPRPAPLLPRAWIV